MPNVVASFLNILSERGFVVFCLEIEEMDRNFLDKGVQGKEGSTDSCLQRCSLSKGLNFETAS